MDKKLILATLLAILLVPFLVIGRAEVVTGDTAVYTTGTVTFSVSTYIEVDFGPGWQNLKVIDPIRPGTFGPFPVEVDPSTTYINVTGNTNTNVDIVFGLPISSVYIQRIFGPVIVEKGMYSAVLYNATPPVLYIPPPTIDVEINVPLGTRAGTYSDSFVICVLANGLSPYHVCPPL